MQFISLMYIRILSTYVCVDTHVFHPQSGRPVFLMVYYVNGWWYYVMSVVVLCAFAMVACVSVKCVRCWPKHRQDDS